MEKEEREKKVVPDESVKAKQVDLRQKAEEIVRHQNILKEGTADPIPPDEARRLLHELQVHQVELEAQNEELHRSEVELEVARRRYFDLFELAPMGYLTVSNSGSILEANLTAANLFGVAKSLLIKSAFSSFIFREDQDAFYLSCKDQCLKGELTTCELRMRRGKDALFWARVQRKRMCGIDGQPVFFTTVSDVSDRKAVEEALQRSEARLSSILEGQTDLICRYLPDGRLSYVNEAYLRFFGKKREELLNQNFIPHIPEADLAVINEKLRKISPGNPIAKFDHRVIMPNGVIHWQEWIHRGVFDANGNQVEVQAVGRDITERKLAEAARDEIERLLVQSQKMEGLTKMAAGIAHDFNNLLAIIRLNLDLATMDDDRAFFLRHLEAIRETVVRAAGLTEKMLAYSGKGRFCFTDVQLNDAVSESIRQFQSNLPNSVQIHVKLAEKLPPMHADEVQVHQVIMCLLANACESLGGKPGTLQVETRLLECTQRTLAAARPEASAEPGWFVAVEIRDNGCGMDEEILAHMFDPFYTTKFIGRGLGLSAVLGIVRGHKGAIMIRSRVGEGTSFNVLFPAVMDLLPAPVEKTLESARLEGCSGVVLVVDDEPLLLDLCSTALRNIGIRVLSAADGQEAVDIFRKNADAIQCVLLDLTMPRMNGWAVFDRIRQIKPGIRVILTSGYCEADALSQFHEEKPECFLQKPFTFGSLKENVIRLLQVKN